MPLALTTIGLVLLITAFNGTFGDLFAQLKKDLTGQFLYWMVAVIIVGSIGYIPGWEKPSRMFLALIIIALVLANGGLFTQLTNALATGPTPDPGGQQLSQVNTLGGNTASPSSVGTMGLITGTAAGLAAGLPTTPGVTTGAPIGAVATNVFTGLGKGGV